MHKSVKFGCVMCSKTPAEKYTAKEGKAAYQVWIFLPVFMPLWLTLVSYLLTYLPLWFQLMYYALT